jgi:hypothetical protein
MTQVLDHEMRTTSPDTGTVGVEISALRGAEHGHCFNRPLFEVTPP